MELKEARKWADVIAKLKAGDLSYCEKAGIVLDNRIIELEKEKDELKEKVKSLTQTVRRRESLILM